VLLVPSSPASNLHRFYTKDAILIYF